MLVDLKRNVASDDMPSRLPKYLWILLAWLACALAALAWFARPCRAQENTRRLILKDGSYQLVTKYEVKGDRVRYYSSERQDWEELPNSLVDWPATEKYEKERTSTNVPEAVQLDNEIAHDNEVEEAKLPEVAPGLRLPEGSGVFLLDNYKGESQIDEISQSAGDVSRNSKANIFHGISGKATIELDGAHASIQAHVDVPSLYINNADEPAPFEGHGVPLSSTPSAQQPQQTQQPIASSDRFRIVRIEVKNNKRILGEVKRDGTGQITQDQKIIKTTGTVIKGGWLKLSPTESLAPGEYALVEMMGKEGMNIYVWDFGVNPNAPANANPWKPEAKSATTPPPAAKSQ
jgi:hypothetical protein